MAVPELYKYGRKGKYFNHYLFLLYMIEGIIQSVIIFFFCYYAYDKVTTRPDGYDVYIYEMSTTMVVASATACNLFNGLNIHSWTWWIVFGVFIGIFLIWAFTVSILHMIINVFRIKNYLNRLSIVQFHLL